MLRCDGRWLFSNPALDSLVCGEPPGVGLVSLLQRLLNWAERSRSGYDVVMWLREQGVALEEAEILLRAFVDAALLVPEHSESPWLELATTYPDVREAIRFITFRRSVQFVDYADPDVLSMDRDNMENFEQSEPPPAIYKHYPGTPRVSLVHPSTSSPHDAFSRLSHLLYWGYGRLREVWFHQLPAMLKPVPSMGARHPFEAYVWIGEDGMLDPGIYHYCVEEHTLEYIGRWLDEEYALQPDASQGWGREHEANAMKLITTVIFDRFQWRYRHAWNYKDLFYDLGHVSATLKFVAEELGVALKPVVGELSLPGTAPLFEEVIAMYRLECL